MGNKKKRRDRLPKAPEGNAPPATVEPIDETLNPQAHPQEESSGRSVDETESADGVETPVAAESPAENAPDSSQDEDKAAEDAAEMTTADAPPAETPAAKKTGAPARIRAAALLITLAIALFVGGGVFGYRYYSEYMSVQRMRDAVYRETIYPGISIDGMDVGGLTLEAALPLVEQHAQERARQYAITVEMDDRDWTLDLQPSYDAAAALEAAYQIGREGELDERYALISEIAVQGRDCPLEMAITASDVDAFLEEIAGDVSVEPVNARFESFDAQTHTMRFTQDTPGLALPKDTLLAAIRSSMDMEAYPIAIHASLVEVPAEISRESAQAQMQKLSSFTTKTTRSTSRNTNIRIASEAFHGVVIQPGETFSINECTGRRTADRGYKSAGAIRNGKIENELGGGVCQVSTTLFNAAVRAGLTIDERHNHSYPIDYVPKGHDAMINYPGSDLKFTNGGSGPVILISRFEDYHLTVEVYGAPILPEGVTVELKEVTTATFSTPSEITRYDSSKPSGSRTVDRKGRRGYNVTTYIQYYKGEEMIDEQVLFESKYRAIAPIVVYGSGDSGFIAY